MKFDKSVRVNTGEQEKVYRQVEHFFNLVEGNVDGESSHFERETYGLHRHAPAPVPLDDNIHMLKYHERVVAAVTETRDDFNFVVFDFFTNVEEID